MNLPKGLVTFLCLSLESVPSTLHDQIRSTVSKRGAAIFQADTLRIYSAFAAIIPALTAAITLQKTLTTDGVPPEHQPAIAIHTGPANPWNQHYTGETYNRAQSILAAVHPGQIVLSAASQASIIEHMPAQTTLRNLGAYRLNDLLPAMPLAQVVVADLASEFPPLKTLEQYTHNLPILLSPLIGRDHEVQAVRTLLDAPATRHVTMIGSSGAGKTRLALQVAVEQVEAFPDGVFVVSLAPVIDPNLVLTEIAHTLHIKEQGQQPLLETVVETLANKRLLVILDNFEQLITAAPLLQQILTATTHLKLLVTSQIACEIPQEQIFHLPPLTLPEQTDTLPIDELGQIPAVALFIQRAREINPTFAFNSTSAPAVVELCSRLGGLPLAIELVAAQSKRYFPNDMLLLLKRHLLMAKATGRSTSRKDILYPVMDWICEVLGTNVAGFFARLGVFAGGCTPESAAICNPENDLRLDVSKTLNLLLDNHLLLREELKADYVRFTMLDAVHEYAQQRLDKRRETPRFQQLHAEFYTALAEEAAPQLLGSNQIVWLNRLESTHHNLREALKWGGEHQVLLLARLAGALRRFWYMYSHFSEGLGWLELARTHLASLPPQQQADILHGVALLSLGQGKFDYALPLLHESLNIRRTLGDVSGVIMLLGNIGAVNSVLGDTEAAIRATREGIEFGRQSPNLSKDDEAIILRLIGNLGAMIYYEGDFELAKTYIMEDYLQKLQNQQDLDLCYSLNNLGLVEYQTGEYEQAHQHFNEGLAIARSLPHEVMEADILGNLAKVLIVKGDVLQARALLDDALVVREKHGDSRALALTLETYAQLALAEGNPARAVRLNRIAINMFKAVTTRITPLAQRHQQTIEATARPLLSDKEFTAAQAAPAMEFAEIIAYTRSRE